MPLERLGIQPQEHMCDELGCKWNLSGPSETDLIYLEDGAWHVLLMANLAASPQSSNDNTMSIISF